MRISLSLRPLARLQNRGAGRGNSVRMGWILGGLIIGGSLALVAETIRVLFVGNVHEVVPGRVYRSAQLSGAKLHDFVKETGIRSVVNLRGCCMYFDWYLDECRTNQELNVSQEDITFSANRLPAPSELRRLIEVFDRTEYPILLHCRQGADRTGLASAVYMLLYTNADYRSARAQCGARYAHVPVLSTVNMDRFFDLYEQWLSRHSLEHRTEHFRHWALNEYCAHPAPAKLELIDPVPELAVGEPLTLHVRVENHSDVAWQMKTGSATGIHCRYFFTSPDAKTSPIFRAGLFETLVAPGQSIELALPFPPFRQPGIFKVNVDMADRVVNFCQLGSEFLAFDIHVRDTHGR